MLTYAPPRQPARSRDTAFGYPAKDDFGDAYDDGGDDLAATLLFYVRLVLKRKWLIAGVTLMATTLGALYALMQTPLYTATVRLQIDADVAKVVEGSAADTARVGTSTEFLRTQYELLQSRSLAERVVSALQLQANDDFLAPRHTSPLSMVRSALANTESRRIPSPLAIQAQAVGMVMDNVTVRPVPGSRLVDVSYKDPRSARAQRIANAYADAFVASNLDKRFQANAYAKTFLEDQIAQLRLRLKESEQDMLAFADRERIVQVGERASIAENNLSAANQALGGLISARIKSEESWRQVAQADTISVPELLSNSVVDGLRGRRNTLAADYEEKLETFKPSYPEMVQIANKIKEIDRQLDVEVETIRRSLKAAYETALGQERQMRERIEALRSEVLELQKRSVQHNLLQREVETNRKLYNSLLQRLREVDVASGVGTNNVFIVDAAQGPNAPSEPRLGRTLILSFALGLFGGLGGAYLLEILDDRVRVPEEIEELTGLSTIGIIPAGASEDAFVDAFNDPHSAVSEAYRSLATALQFATETGLPRSLALTSAGPGEGKSSTAIAIARHFATVGMRVLLVDADLRKPSLHTKLNLDNSIGLSNYLTGASTPPETFQATETQNLTFMASGPLPPNAADLLAGTRMFSLISVGLEAFDLIVVDGPPLLGLADAQLLTNSVAGTVFVVGSAQQRKGAIRNALRRLGQARIPVLGVVLTKFDAKASGYGYGYGYSYSYSYGSSAYTYGTNADEPVGSIPDQSRS